MGLKEILFRPLFQSPQSPSIKFRWREPFLFRVRVGDQLVYIFCGAFACLVLIPFATFLKCFPKGAFQEMYSPILALLGFVGSLCYILIQCIQSRDITIKTDRIVYSYCISSYCDNGEYCMYDEIRHCTITPYEMMYRKFSILEVVGEDGETIHLGIPQGVDIQAVAEYLYKKGVPLSVRRTTSELPASSKKVILVIAIILLMTIPHLLAYSKLSRRQEPPTKKQEIHQQASGERQEGFAFPEIPRPEPFVPRHIWREPVIEEVRFEPKRTRGLRPQKSRAEKPSDDTSNENLDSFWGPTPTSTDSSAKMPTRSRETPLSVTSGLPAAAPREVKGP